MLIATLTNQKRLFGLMAGKGSAPRVDRDGKQKKKYESNWDRIFKSGKSTQISDKTTFHENGVNFEPKK
jgi:hypothetical protein